MATILYAEIYVICLIITGLLLFWGGRSGTNSTSERWLRFLLIAFEINFASNLIFALVNNLLPLESLRVPLAYGFKTLFHITLAVGVYAWCGYADLQNQGAMVATRRNRLLSLILLAIPTAAAILNLRNHQLFTIGGQGEYIRGPLFQWEMGYLAVLSAWFAMPLLKRLPEELEPSRRAHIWLLSSFPLCILAAWLLSVVAGEKVPVICVCVTVELLCLYVDISTRQISMDKLTQVNNRQNLLSFLEYKMKFHEESIFLLMIDVDYFKSINDTYGHLEGDEALIQISRILKNSCSGYRRRPYIGRYGGDEFIIILEGTRDEREHMCETIRENLRFA